jgi:hypothetical protein
MRRYNYRLTLFAFLTFIGVTPAPAAQSLKEAAESFARYFNAPYLVRYELGRPDVSDNYPNAGVPNGIKIYPIRMHWWWPRQKSFLRSDFFLYQDNFNSWKFFYTERSYLNDGHAAGPIWLLVAWADESMDEACVTEEQRSAFTNWKEMQAQRQAAIKPTSTPAYVAPEPRWDTKTGNTYETKSNAEIVEEGRRAFGGGSPNPTEVAVKPSSSQVAAPDANSTPSDAPPPIRSHDQATAAFNFLQDRLQKPHAQSVSYDPQTDSYVWLGPKSGRKMSLARNQFETEIWLDYAKAHPTETLAGSSSGGNDLDSKIAAAEKELNLVYTRLREHLNEGRRIDLKNRETTWITKKDSLPAQQKLSAVEERTRFLQGILKQTVGNSGVQ